MKTTGRIDTGSDRGFTLVELLIVIVILGILATVTVFAVRGITAEGQENACSVDLKNLATAEEAHWALNGSYADEATLVSSGSITKASDNFDVTSPAGGDTYAINPATGSQCTNSATGGGGSATPPPAPVVMPSNSFAWHPNGSGVTAWRYPSDVNGDDEIVLIGGATGRADWVSTNDAGTASPRRTHFVDITSLTASDLDGLLAAIDNNGLTALGLYGADDTAPLAGSASASVGAYLATVIGAYPNITLVNMGPGSLAGVFANPPT